MYSRSYLGSNQETTMWIMEAYFYIFFIASRCFCCRPSTRRGFSDAQQPTPLCLQPNPPPCHLLNNSRQGLWLSQGGERKELGWQGQAEPGQEKSAPNHLLRAQSSIHFRSARKELLMASLLFVEVQCEMEKYLHDFCLPICYLCVQNMAQGHD